jgi:hypothetical protein
MTQNERKHQRVCVLIAIRIVYDRSECVRACGVLKRACSVCVHACVLMKGAWGVRRRNCELMKVAWSVCRRCELLK